MIQASRLIQEGSSDTMKRSLIFLLATFAASIVFANAWDNVLFKGRTDKENPVGYTSGESIVFTLVATDVPASLENAGFFVEWKRTGDDGKIETGKTPFKSGETCKITTRLDKPGFVRLEAHVVDAIGKRVQRDTTAPGAFDWQRHVSTASLIWYLLASGDTLNV